jgi:GH18 family chitinase
MGYPKNKIFMGISLDKDGDNEKTIQYKEDFVRDTGIRGLMVWN